LSAAQVCLANLVLALPASPPAHLPTVKVNIIVR
jgi:hypothetical protein